MTKDYIVLNRFTGTPLTRRRYATEEQARAAIVRAQRSAALKDSIGWEIVAEDEA